MERISIDKSELKELMKESFIEVLTERNDLLEIALLEAIEDIGLGKAIQEGDTGEYVDEEVIFEKLRVKE